MSAKTMVCLQRIAIGAMAFVLLQVSTVVAQESVREVLDKGIELHMAKKYDEALKWHKKASEMKGEVSGIGHYNMGCVYAIKKNADKAFECLTNAVAAGMLDVAQFEGDEDLANIKDDPRFAKLIARVKNGGEPVEDEKKEMSPSIAGNWMIKSGTRSGAEIPKERLTAIAITDKTVTIPAGPSKFVMSYKLDTTKSPFEIDMKIESGPVPDGAATGIVKMDGNKLMLCYNSTGGDRPADFKTADGDNCFYFEMEKTKPELTAESIVGAWTIVEGTRAGAKVAAERFPAELVFTKDGITMGEGEKAFKMSYTLNLEKSPSEIDMKITGGPAPAGIPATGIMKMDSDGHLLLCYDGMGGARPEAFESTEENGRFLFKMKKKK